MANSYLQAESVSGNSQWTSERVAYLRKLAAEGLSSSRIAVILGTTRNAVIGKRWRLGASDGNTAPKTRTKPKGKRVKSNIAPLGYPFTGREEPPHVPVVDAIARVGLNDLEQKHCRWPVGHPKEPGFGFCGHDRAHGSSYCEFHRQASITKPEPKKRVTNYQRKRKLPVWMEAAE